MRRWPIAIIGAIALALPIMGLVEVADRAGPIDATLAPVNLEAQVTGSFMTRGDTSVLGVCLEAPCDPATAIDLRIRGLPELRYTARLVGATTVDLGPLRWDGDVAVFQWTDDAEHAGQGRIELMLAGRAIASWPLNGNNVDLDGPVAVSWNMASADVHLAEIGMVTVSTIALATLAEPAPDGWVFRAVLEGTTGRIDMGVLEGDGTVLDRRVERLPLEDQDRILIELVPRGAIAGPGYPVLAAEL